MPWPGARGATPVPVGELAPLGLPVLDDGLTVGQDASGRTVSIRLLRPEPCTVVLVGGVGAAQLLTLRALAAGARVAVETGRAHLWSAPDRVAPQAVPTTAAQLTVHQLGGPGPQHPTADTPLLLVRDAGAEPAGPEPPPRPWQTVVLLLPFLSPTAAFRLATADLVGLQRLSPQEASSAAAELSLTADEERLLPQLGEGVTLWAAGARRLTAWSPPTAAGTHALADHPYGGRGEGGARAWP